MEFEDENMIPALTSGLKCVCGPSSLISSHLLVCLSILKETSTLFYSTGINGASRVPQSPCFGPWKIVVWYLYSKSPKVFPDSALDMARKSVLLWQLSFATVQLEQIKHDTAGFTAMFFPVCQCPSYTTNQLLYWNIKLRPSSCPACLSIQGKKKNMFFLFQIYSQIKVALSTSKMSNNEHGKKKRLHPKQAHKIKTSHLKLLKTEFVGFQRFRTALCRLALTQTAHLLECIEPWWASGPTSSLWSWRPGRKMVEDGCSRMVEVGMNSSCELCWAGLGRQVPEASSWQRWGHHSPERQAAEKLEGNNNKKCL